MPSNEEEKERELEEEVDVLPSSVVVTPTSPSNNNSNSNNSRAAGRKGNKGSKARMNAVKATNPGVVKVGSIVNEAQASLDAHVREYRTGTGSGDAAVALGVLEQDAAGSTRGSASTSSKRKPTGKKKKTTTPAASKPGAVSVGTSDPSFSSSDTTTTNNNASASVAIGMLEQDALTASKSTAATKPGVVGKGGRGGSKKSDGGAGAANASRSRDGSSSLSTVSKIGKVTSNKPAGVVFNQGTVATKLAGGEIANQSDEPSDSNVTASVVITPGAVSKAGRGVTKKSNRGARTSAASNDDRVAQKVSSTVPGGMDNMGLGMLEADALAKASKRRNAKEKANEPGAVSSTAIAMETKEIPPTSAIPSISTTVANTNVPSTALGMLEADALTKMKVSSKLTGDTQEPEHDDNVYDIEQPPTPRQYEKKMIEEAFEKDYIIGETDYKGNAKEKFDDIEDIAIAVAIDDEEEEFFATAEKVDLKDKMWQNRRFMFLTVSFMIFGLLAAVGIVFSITKETVPAPPPVSESAAPSFAPTGLGLPNIKDILTPISGSGALNDGASPQSRAAAWLAGSDGMNLSPDDPLLYQRYALSVLYFAFDGDNWKNCSANDASECPDENRWLSNAHECEWYGVICNKRQIVRALYLADNNLNGETPEEILLLVYMRILSLNANKIRGTLPENINKLDHLGALYLHGNSLTGTIPSQLYTMDKLQAVNLSINKLEGTVSDSFGNLSNLKGLQLFDNPLKGTIPSVLGSLQSLSYLYLFNMKLSGIIPEELFSGKSFRHLYLMGNDLSGELPGVAPNSMQHLEHLLLQDNKISGTFPSSYTSLTSLKTLYIQNNQMIGTLPNDIGDLNQIQKLVLSTNKFEGTVPISIGNMTGLVDLFLHNTDFTGTVPTSLCTLDNIDNLFSDCLGAIPEIKCDCCTACCDFFSCKLEAD